MISASFGAVPGLLPAFLLLTALAVPPVWYVARLRGRPVAARVLFTAGVAGVVSVTLLPGSGSSGQGAVCDTGSPFAVLTTWSTGVLLNVALFAPAPFFAVLAFRRPLTVAASAALASGLVELLQAESDTGRACSLTDVGANTVGALLGAAAGALWLWRGKGVRRSAPRAGPDAVWGLGIAVVGFLALAGIFRGSVSGYDAGAADHERRAVLRASAGADDWITAAAVDIFGADVRIRQTQTVRSGDRLHLEIFTDRGELTGWWPDRTLERGVAHDSGADAGSMTEEQARAVSERFTRRWFPREAGGGGGTSRTRGDSADRIHRFTYRSTDGTATRTRLEVTVGGAGRIVGFRYLS
ncbi:MULTISPECIES: VanZ family protein [unclassified Streptomyces]|uniref:VanZ family protein n=1 Tax=unclassified Streptomyces TaxID=2593676 RepID=UPI002E28599A|nr:VanZ family protein [Streptomyces sp. NBC_00223]